MVFTCMYMVGLQFISARQLGNFITFADPETCEFSSILVTISSYDFTPHDLPVDQTCTQVTIIHC